MRALIGALCLGLWACGGGTAGDPRVPRVVDATTRPTAPALPDRGPSDATGPAAGRSDAATPDGGAPDATRPDATPPDAGPLDGATGDAAPPGPTGFLALGDSYTIGESVPPEGRWPVQLAERLRQAQVAVDPPRIIARTGWSVAQLLAAVADRDPPGPFGLVTLLTGVNDHFRGGTVQAYGPAFAEALGEAIRRAGGRACRVVVLAIPDYGYTPFGRGDRARISPALDAFNAVSRAQAAAAGAHYVNIVPISRRGLAEPDLVAPDGLHPSAAQYAEWAVAAQAAATQALTSCP